MRGSKGFTLIEIMVVIAILGILGALAIPTYQTMRRMAVGSEATAVMKQMVDAEIAYFLENNQYFPPEDVGHVAVWHDAPADREVIKEALKITLPVGHHLDFQLLNTGVGVTIIITGEEGFFDNIVKFIDPQGNVE